MPPLTVLVADDDADMRRYLRGCLLGLATGVDRVLEASDGLEALTLVRSGLVQLLLTDIAMPGMDGWELCRLVKADAGLRHVSVLLMSGAEYQLSGRAGEDGVLVKPFNAQQLTQVVQQLLNSREA